MDYNWHVPSDNLTCCFEGKLPPEVYHIIVEIIINDRMTVET